MKRKRILAGVLVAVTILSTAACETKKQTADEADGNKEAAATVADATVWSAPATVKVLSTAAIEDYEDVKTDTISLVSGKNEYESGQIIVSAQKDLSFTVSLSDLVEENNAGIISKDHFTVYTQKYINVLRNWHGNGAAVGGYPDAILPQENAVAYEQNVVKKGNNGGAWLEFFIPEDTPAGTYKGEATVTVGDSSQTMPISLKVYNVTVPTESTQKSVFTVSYTQVEVHELDSSWEMAGKYFDLLLKYRCSPTSVATDATSAEEFAERAYAYCQKGMSTIGLPTGGGSQYLDGLEVFDYEYTAERIVALAKKSLDSNYDLLKKAAFYNWRIDEPFCAAYPDGQVAASIKAFDLAIEKAIADLKADPSFTGAFADQLLADIRNIPDVVTDYNTDAYGNSHRLLAPVKNADGSLFSYEGTDVSICAKPDAYGSEEERATYRNGRELWWYSCNEPRYPYPSYHIDDTMTSTIAFEWMMAEYDIVGNLYWAVNYHMDESGQNLENAYDVAHRGSGANGEGAIIYPGKQYGVDGPVASIRLDAIRDGYEDYELIRILKEGYAALGKDSSDLIHQITESIYKESSIVGDSAEYEAAREILLQSVEAMQSPAQLTINSIRKEEAASGEQYSFTISAAEGTELYSDDTKLTVQDGQYTIVKSLTESRNYLKLSAKKDDTQSIIRIYLGGKQAAWQKDTFNEENVTGDISARQQDESYYRVTTNASGGKWQIVTTHESLQQINEKTAHYLMKLYAEKETAYTIYVTYSGFGKVAAQSGTLNVGMNQIDLDFFTTVNWTRNKSITEITIMLEDGTWIGLGEIKLYEV